MTSPPPLLSEPIPRSNPERRTDIARDRHPKTSNTVVVPPRSPAPTTDTPWGVDSPGAASRAPTSVWVAPQIDWARRASPRDAHQHVTIWKQAAPQVDGFDSPAQILDAVGRVGPSEQSCRLLSGLLLAARHDGLAAYAVLVAIIPGLRVAAGRRWQTAQDGGPWWSRDELDIDTISASWQAIAAHAGERHLRPARLIVRQVERRLRSSYDAYQRLQSRGFPIGDAELQIPDPPAAGKARQRHCRQTQPPPRPLATTTQTMDESGSDAAAAEEKGSPPVPDNRPAVAPAPTEARCSRSCSHPPRVRATTRSTPTQRTKNPDPNPRSGTAGPTR